MTSTRKHIQRFIPFFIAGSLMVGGLAVQSSTAHAAAPAAKTVLVSNNSTSAHAAGILPNITDMFRNPLKFVGKVFLAPVRLIGRIIVNDNKIISSRAGTWVNKGHEWILHGAKDAANRWKAFMGCSPKQSLASCIFLG